MDTLERHHARLLAELGHHEQGFTNCNEYSAEVLHPCESWCLDFQVCMELRGGLAPPTRSAACNTLMETAKVRGLWVARANLRAGMLTLFHFPGEHAGANHVGWLESIEVGVSVTTLDGNTSEQSQTNGGVVQRRRRAWSLVLGGVKLTYAPSAPGAGGGNLPGVNYDQVGFLVPDDQLVELDLVRDVLHYPDLISGTGPTGVPFKQYVLLPFSKSKPLPAVKAGSVGVGTKVSGWAQFSGSTRYDTRTRFLVGIGWRG